MGDEKQIMRAKTPQKIMEKVVLLRGIQSNGYHMVEEYASWRGTTSQPYDFAKVVPSSNYDGLCDNGAFRNHAGINRNFSYEIEKEEPNPKVLSYVWPYTFWGLYVQWWHNNF